MKNGKDSEGKSIHTVEYPISRICSKDQAVPNSNESNEIIKENVQ